LSVYVSNQLYILMNSRLLVGIQVSRADCICKMGLFVYVLC